MKTIMIGLPCYSGKVHVQTMRALMGDVILLLSKGYKFMIAEDVGNSDIAACRAAIVATFYRSIADELIFIDDDVFWTQGDMVKLVEYPVDVVGGVYPKKTEEVAFPVRMDLKEEYRTNSETGLMEVAGLPGGFMKITRNCVEQMIKAYPKTTQRSTNESSEFWPFFDPLDISGDRLSEDFSFCERFRQIGGKVWADFEMEMGHIGYKSYKGSMGNYLRSLENNVK